MIGAIIFLLIGFFLIGMVLEKYDISWGDVVILAAGLLLADIGWNLTGWL